MVRCKYPSNNPLILESLFLQKNVSPVAAHPIKVDKCGGEIAKLATSSHSKAIETCKDACHQDTFQKPQLC